MQFIPAVFVIQIPHYHQLGESCGVADREPRQRACPLTAARAKGSCVLSNRWGKWPWQCGILTKCAAFVAYLRWTVYGENEEGRQNKGYAEAW